MPSAFKFRRGEQLSTLLQITAVCTLFRSHKGVDFVQVPQSAFARNAYPLDSPDFKAWMVNRFQDERDAPPTAHALRTVLQTLRAQAQFGQTGEAPAGPRLIPGNGTIVLDLADAESRCVEITSNGWKPEHGAAFAFERCPDTGQLPVPDSNPSHDTLDRLRSLLNIPAGAPWTRTLTWLIAAMRPEGPYPILVLRGPCGCGKSTTARALRSLLDPTRTPLQTLPNTPRQIEKAAAGQRILAIDDIDRIPRALLSPLAKIADETAPVVLVLSSRRLLHSPKPSPAAA